jgi:lambda family phage portal protein
VFKNLRKTIARAIAPARPRMSPLDRAVMKALREPTAKPSYEVKPGAHGARHDTRMYQAARASRLTAGFGTSTTSADSELVSSLTNLRNRSRALVRDASYAKRAKVIVQNNVIGSGIGMQAQVMSTRDELRENVNDAIEEAWREWCCAEYCHTGGTLHFADFERALMGQVFEAGEVFVRKHYHSFGGSEVPFALELIESERVADEFMSGAPAAEVAPGAIVKMGIEQDRHGRPLAYWVRRRHPGELRFIQGETDMVERVPADQIVHLRLVDRWPQTRGEPWLHAVARKLNDMDGYSEAEIVAARGAASYVFTIETPDDNSPLAGQTATGADAGASVSKEVVVEPGMGVRMAPGEEWKTHAPNRPNTALDPFMRYMLREVAAGAGVSYESLSRDYSQSNYSSSRLALLDDRDLWKMLQQWFIRNFRFPLHKQWLQSAMLSGSIPGVGVEQYATDPKKFEAVLFKPRGWGWIDPTKEVEAAEKSVKAGFTTRADVIAATADGRDIEDIDRQREREIRKEAQLKLEFTTSPSVYVPAETKAGQGVAKPKLDAPPEDESPPGEGTKPTKNGPPLRAVSI